MKWRASHIRFGRRSFRSYHADHKSGRQLVVYFNPDSHAWFGRVLGGMTTSWKRLSAFRAGDAMAEWEKQAAELLR